MAVDKVDIFYLRILKLKRVEFRSRPGEQRDTVLQDYISNDLLTCRKHFPQAANAGFQMLSLLESDDLVVRQYAVRLYNTLASLQQGKN